MLVLQAVSQSWTNDVQAAVLFMKGEMSERPGKCQLSTVKLRSRFAAMTLIASNLDYVSLDSFSQGLHNVPQLWGRNRRLPPQVQHSEEPFFDKTTAVPVRKKVGEPLVCKTW